MVTNANNEITILQNVTPKSLTLSGITSPMTVNGSVKIANAAVKRTNEKLTIGTQLNASTLYCHDFSIMYIPKAIRPKAVPIVETKYKN